jgi:hypothetical protein
MTACFNGNDFSRGPRAFREALERLRGEASSIVCSDLSTQDVFSMPSLQNLIFILVFSSFTVAQRVRYYSFGGLGDTVH